MCFQHQGKCYRRPNQDLLAAFAVHLHEIELAPKKLKGERPLADLCVPTVPDGVLTQPRCSLRVRLYADEFLGAEEPVELDGFSFAGSYVENRLTTEVETAGSVVSRPRSPFVEHHTCSIPAHEEGVERSGDLD